MSETSKVRGLNASEHQPAIIYCRTASWPQAGGSEALAQQEERCRAYAKERGYTVIDVVRDCGVSGTNCERAGIKTILDRLKNEDGFTILVDQTNRLARDVKMIKDLEATLSHHGASIDYPAKQIMLSRGADKLTEVVTQTLSRSRSRRRD